MVKWSEISVGNAAKKLYSRISPETKLAFASTFVIGFFTHCFGFFNLYLNHDGIDNIFDYKDMTSSGRWLLEAACSLSGSACLPVVIGLLSLLYLSAACAMITELFKIKNKGYVILTSAFIAAFPAVTQTFTYMFTADGYMLSFMLAVAAVFVARRYRLGFLPAALLICLSLGIYQSSVSVCIVLFTLVIAVDILDGGKTKDIFVGILKYLASGVLGGVLYFAALKVILAIRNIFLSDYKGIGDMTIGLGSLKTSAVKAVSTNLLIMFKNGYSGFGGNVVLGVLLITLALLAVLLVLKRAMSAQIYKKPLLFLLLPILFLSLPFSMCCILFVSPKANYYLVMFMSFSIVFAAVPVIFERYLSVSSLMSCIHKYLTTAVSVLFVIHFIVFANYTYVETVIQTKNTEALMSQVVSELYEIEDFGKKPILMTCDVSKMETAKKPNYMYGKFRYIYLGYAEHGLDEKDRVYEDLAVYLKLYYGIDCTPMKSEEFKKIEAEAGYKELAGASDNNRAYNIIEYDGKIVVVLNKMFD